MTEARAALTELKKLADAKTLARMSRYGIPSGNALGVPVGRMRALARSLRAKGRDDESRAQNHRLALELWELDRPRGVYEARMLACFVDDPTLVTPAQMDKWARDFDSWAICDTACFHLFDRTPHAMKMIARWAKKRDEYVKRAAFALLASIAGHDNSLDDGVLLACLPMIEAAAKDDRNFVKKGVSWALRSFGRRGAELRAAAIELAARLAESSEPSARWIGKDALRDLGRVKPKRDGKPDATKTAKKSVKRATTSRNVARGKVGKRG